MVFTSEMVHILPGYPNMSPNDPLISFLAFYLKFGDNIVRKEVLKAIVESGMSSIERSTGSNIMSVQPLFITANEAEARFEESNPAKAVIIAVTVAGVLLLVIIGALVVSCKRNNR